MTKFIGIIGAGPAGCALACFLKEKNIDCVVFDDNHTPDIIVGESLVSAIIPLLRRLGIEKRVAEVSTVKLGAALRHENGNRVDFKFKRFGFKYPSYSYNVSRPEFDLIMRQRAKELGVKFVNVRAKVEATTDDPNRDLQLCDETLAMAGLSRASQPSLLVDASGRTRLFSRTLNITSTRGNRNDVSYFAHYKNFDCDSIVQGQIVLSILESGWSWQIPLKDRLSVGVVLDKKVAKNFGSSAEERLENIINASPLLAKNGSGRERVSTVKSYSNYQLLSKQGYGKGWVLLGDAFGFVDPMLSPGIHMSIESAALLEKHVISKAQASEQDFDHYCAEFKDWYNAWDYLVKFFYDGRILSMAEVRESIQNSSNPFSIPKLVEPYISRVLSSLVSGIKTRSKFNQQILFHSSQRVAGDPNRIAAHTIHSSLDDFKPEKDNTHDIKDIA